MFDYCLQNRTELENHSVDSSSTSEVVAFITLLQGLKRKLKDWKGKVEVCIYNAHVHVCLHVD